MRRYRGTSLSHYSVRGLVERVPEIDTPGIQRSVFVLPAVMNKNRQARVIVLNDAARAIIEHSRGQHPVYVFTWINDAGVRNRTGRMRNSGWVNARNRAADSYAAISVRNPQLDSEICGCTICGTSSRRLRAAGVSKEDRKDLLGHESRDVTTEYSRGTDEPGQGGRSANLLVRSKDSLTFTVLRLVA